MKLYSLSKRKKGKADYWYVQFKDDDTGKYGTAKSIDALSKKLGRKPHHITKKAEAANVAEAAAENGLDGNEKITDPVFVDYLKTFWDYDNSPYIAKTNRRIAIEKNKEEAQEFAMSRAYVYNMASCVKNHVEPYIPKGLKCSQVKKSHIEKIQDRLIEQKLVNVWQSTLRCLRKPIKELIDKGILIRDPFIGLEKYSANRLSSVDCSLFIRKKPRN